MNSMLGKYTNYNTVIHRLDSKVKLVGLIVLMVSVFLSYGSLYMNLVFCASLFVLLMIVNIIGKCSFFSIFKSLKAIWIMIIFLFIINVIFAANDPNDTGDIAFTVFELVVKWKTIINILFIFARLILVIMMTNVFASTTKPMDITGALEWLMTPFKLIKVPVHQIAMAIALALRFIPTLQEETEKIMKAQASRGVDFKHGKFKEKIQALISLIIPLFMSAFMTSGELADALEARGYDPNAKRTKYRTNHFSTKDVVACVILAIFMGGYITLSILKPDIFVLLNWSLPVL